MYEFSKQNDRLVITPKDELYDFIRLRFGGKRFNTQKRYAQTLRLFIGDRKLSDIDAEYVKEYITRRAWSGIDRDTHDFEKRAIFKFIEFLEDRGVIAKIDRYELVGLPSATKNISEKINDIKPEYQQMFLETVLIYQPRIAFLVLICMAGGLRPSEALNLTKSAITCIGPFGKDGWIVKIKDRELRPNFTAQCKKTRPQKIQAMGDLGARIYKKHLENYTTENNPALFTDENGNALTYEAFQQRFKRIKKHFIENLKSSGDPAAIAYGNFLETRRWGGHIGRGIFSNDITRHTRNIAEIAGARGDSSPASPIPYIQSDATMRLGQLHQIMTDELLEVIDEIDS